MPEWIALRIPDNGRVRTRRAPLDLARTDAIVKAAREVRRDPPRPFIEPNRSVYVVLLELSPGNHALYVGQTGLTPEDRYLNHKSGHKSSKWVRRYGVGLLPALYRHLNPLDNEPAMKAEVALAESLRGSGMRVIQG